MKSQKPTHEELEQAVLLTVPDIIAPHLTVLFCGINPGLYTAATGYHFARPGNRFWKALFLAGFTPTLFHPSEQERLVSLGYGITNFVPRTSRTAAELSQGEIQQGAQQLVQKVEKYHPKILAILGVDVYRKGFNRPKARVGLQIETIGMTRIWVLPNPSGLNAHYTAESIAQLLKKMKKEVY